MRSMNRRSSIVETDPTRTQPSIQSSATEILRTFDIPVIFITAYPEKLLTGERPEPTYLIAKPFLPETVRWS